MPASAYREPDQHDLPLDLQLDLLVDAELTEDQRHALLLALDREPNNQAWRGLAIRFLQRQVERESVRHLMDGGNVVPVEFIPAARRRRRLAFADWLGAPGSLAIAAGLLIAVASATLTVYVMKPEPVSHSGPRETLVTLPGQVMGVTETVPVRVPVVNAGRALNSDLFRNPPGTPGNGANVGRRSVVIQPDADGNAVVIPVNTLRNVNWY